MSEILAPAGDKNSAIAAINAGADAIYLGLKSYSARSFADNFGFEELEEITKYAHAFGVKVYAAMNTMVKQSETEEFILSVIRAWNCGVDAIIISDIFFGKFIKKNYPQIVLHLSTQAGVCNEYAALLAKEYGFSRVILSRETTLSDIQAIAKIIETEVFVQGALCTCFSGQCYLSSFAGGNSGNRGKCKQPCRKKYSIDRQGFEEYAYRLSLSDLSVGQDIKQLIDAGVYSFKIEGRMRRPEYVSAAVKYYRNILDGKPQKSDLSDLKRTFNRGNYTRGLAFGQDKTFISSAIQGHIGEMAGIIKVENGKYIVKSDGKFVKGDGFKILRDGREIGGAQLTELVRGGFVLGSRTRLKNGDKAFITTDNSLNSALLSQKRLIKLDIEADFSVGKSPEVTVNGIKFFGGALILKAENRPLSVEDIENCFKKVDTFPFEIGKISVTTDGVFMAKSELNSFRRFVFESYFDCISQNKNERIAQNHTLPAIKNANNHKIVVICTDLREIQADIGIIKISDENNFQRFTDGFKGEKYLFLPPYMTGGELKKVIEILDFFDGVYSDGIYALGLCKKYGKKFFAGCGLNISNSVGVSECGAHYIALSKELTVREAEEICADNCFYFTAGNIKVMDLIYCTFGKTCKSCDMRERYTLSDEDGRKFTLRRYKASGCRFELYNCANLVCGQKFGGILADFTLENAEKPSKMLDNAEKLKDYFGKSVTRGHSVSPVE